ncbi:MAG: hypothetical protein EOP00_19845 [Pedobacter sp.]|nr:MAG: hypothetical protein EOP00_19845 [Pedobacter sp.]
MKEVSRDIIINDYEKFVRVAEKLVAKNHLQSACVVIDTCVRIAYNFNFIYADDRLEALMSKITTAKLRTTSWTPKENKYVFYDYFGNTKVLTQQYLRALMSWGVEFMYLLEEANPEKNAVILQEIHNYDKATVAILKKGSRFEKMEEMHTIITKYQPKKAFLHMAPWDLVGVCVWNELNQVDRYLINLTDHAFWLGKGCADYILEFRKYGFNLSLKNRGIAIDKLLYQPYYPIATEHEFQGFPIDVTGKIVAFSGASFYKIYGRSGKFLYLIKKILDQNKNLIFFLAGWGIDDPIKKFIHENNFNDRFFLLGERKDISQVFQHIDIFINTYPFIGGLMTQLAVLNKKPIVSYTSSDLNFNYIEDFLDVDSTMISSFKTEEGFVEEVTKLVNDKAYRERNVTQYKDSIPSEDQFNDKLWANCNDSNSNNLGLKSSIEINNDAIFDLYLEVENNYLRLYEKLKLINLGPLYFRYFPFDALKCSLLILFFDFKVIKKI